MAVQLNLEQVKVKSGNNYVPIVVAGDLPEAVKSALLQIAQKVAYIDDDGANYYQDLYDALYPSA